MKSIIDSPRMTQTFAATTEAQADGLCGVIADRPSLCTNDHPLKSHRACPTQDDEEEEPAKSEPAKPAAPAAPTTATAAAPRPPVPAAPVRDIPVNPASKVTQEELVRLSILAENQRSKLADRDGDHSGSDQGSRPGSGSVSSRRPSVVHHNDRSRRDSSTEQVPATIPPSETRVAGSGHCCKPLDMPRRPQEVRPAALGCLMIDGFFDAGGMP